MKRALAWAMFWILVVVVWQKAATNSSDVRFFISSPSASIEYAMSHLTELRTSTFITGIEAIIGFTLAIVFAGAFVIACLFSPSLLRNVLPFFVTSQIVPMITLAPLFIVLFGMGLVSKIAMVTLMCFFPIFVNFISGAQSISPQFHELAYVYNARRSFKVFRIMLPLAMPQGFTGLKVSTTMAMMGAVVAEFLGAFDGLGKNLYLAPKSSQPELMVCSVALVAALGFVFYGAVVLIERIVCKWSYQSGR